jgi:hypothetical protein
VNKTTMRNGVLQWKASILRQHEVYTYQVAYYLLEDEFLAAKAATETLAALIRDEAFFAKATVLQQKQLKQMVMKQSLHTKAFALQSTF